MLETDEISKSCSFWTKSTIVTFCRNSKVPYLGNHLTDSCEILCDVISIQGQWNDIIKIEKFEKGHMRSTLTLGARKSVKVKGQGQGHIRFVSQRGNKWTLLQVSILIRTGVMAKKVFWTFLVTLTLTFDLLSPKTIGLELLPVPICVWNI